MSFTDMICAAVMHYDTLTAQLADLPPQSSEAMRVRALRDVYTDGRFQIYMIPVQARTTQRKDHFRFTLYLQNDAGAFKRTNREMFLKALNEK